MIRYPGSKDKIAKQILEEFPFDLVMPLFQGSSLEYREPFFGGGFVGFRLISQLPRHARIWLNDKDFGICALWNAVKDDPWLLIDKIRSFRPSIDAFYRFQEEDGRTDIDPVEAGFRKFALHQLSFSGLGVKAGGPIGGRAQRSEFNVDCRWNAARHIVEIKKRHAALQSFTTQVRITCRDFSEVITNAPASAFIYADPPYYEKGAVLYKHSMSDEDHRRLATSLKSSRARWVLSYDDQPFIRQLYSFARIKDIELKYTVAVSKTVRRKNSEILIGPRL